MAAVDYEGFLARKRHLGGQFGFEPTFLPDCLFGFQRHLVDWATRQGRGALFTDCGTGKAIMQLVWAENVARKMSKPVLVGTPLAVSHQLVAEGEKFGIKCERSRDGTVPSGARIVVTNYERLHLFKPSDFAGMVCDESSILKNFDGKRKATITEFMRTLPYRLLCTATAAPNDYTELGTSSEALGQLGHMDMLGRFFRNNRNNLAGGRAYGAAAKFLMKPHAEVAFWRWVCSWARAMRTPSDLGFEDGGFGLPPIDEREHVVDTRKRREGWLFDVPAVGMQEMREERGRTIQERCERVAELATHGEQCIIWCHLNAEGDRITKMIDGAEQVRGSDDDDTKESRLRAFADGDLRVLVTKPKIGAWGLNFQNCAHVVMFPSYSYEQYYQAVRRCWRFGQQRQVVVDLVTTEGERGVVSRLREKAAQADTMFSALMRHMKDSLHIEHDKYTGNVAAAPPWL